MPVTTRSLGRAATACVLLLWGGSAWADACVDLTGDFTSYVDPSPECASPVGFCTIGTLTGDVDGTYAFTMTSMVPISDDPAETTFTFTGNSVITTDEGTIYGEDSGQLTFSGDFAFMTFVQAVGGDECLNDVEGSLLATGNLDLVSGVTSGTYDATFCDVVNCYAPGGGVAGDVHGEAP